MLTPLSCSQSESQLARHSRVGEPAGGVAVIQSGGRSASRLASSCCSLRVCLG